MNPETDERTNKRTNERINEITTKPTNGGEGTYKLRTKGDEIERIDERTSVLTNE